MRFQIVHHPTKHNLPLVVRWGGKFATEGNGEWLPQWWFFDGSLDQAIND